MSDSPPAPPPVRRFAGTASVISAHKVAQITGSVATVLLVPRLLGAEDYGRLSFILSLTYLGAILADFGTLDVFGRFVPTAASGDARKLYMRTLAFTAAASVVCFVLTAVAAMVLASWMRPEWALLAGAMVLLRAIAIVPFQYALAQNRIGAWMTEQSWRSWVTLLALLLLYPLLGFTGALLAALVMEVLFAALGLWWARPHWLAGEFRLDMGYYRFYLLAGFGFFMANLAVVVLYRVGPVLVEVLTGETAQAGYINLAVGSYLMVYVTISQFAQSQLPHLSVWRSQGRGQETRRWLGRFLRIGLALTALGTAATWLLADWATPLLFGPEFAPAAASMKWISLALPLAVVVWAANVIATVGGRGAVKFSGVLAALIVCLAGTLLLAPGYGAAGAALATSLAVLVQAVVLTVRLRPEFRLSAAWRAT